MKRAVQEELSRFFEQYKLRTYRKKDIILHEDDTPSVVYYIKSGYIRLYSISKTGEEITRVILSPGDLFPVRWVVAEDRIDYYAESMVDVTAWHAPAEQFEKLVKGNYEIHLAITKMISARLGLIYKHLENLTFGDSYQRLCSLLALMAKHYGVKTTSGIKIRFPLTHRDMATLIGISRERVTIQLDGLKRNKIVEDVNQTVTIKNLKLLEEMCVTTI